MSEIRLAVIGGTGVYKLARLDDVETREVATRFGAASGPVRIGKLLGQKVAFLARHGDPFQRIGLDARSTLQFYLGSSGVPETFVIDGKGIIRYQHIGYIGPQDIDTILQKLREAES